MTVYTYKGRDLQGKRVSGSIEHSNPKAVLAHLQRNNIVVLAITETKSEFDLIHFLQKRKKVNKKEIIIFCRQLHTLLHAGVAINQAIKGLAVAAVSSQLKAALHNTSLMLEEGKELSQALAEFPYLFSEMMIHLIRIGESSGNLAEIFLHIAAYLDFELTTKRQIRAAIRYPLIVVFTLLVAITVMTVWVIPAFSHLFQNLGADLPWATQLLITSSSVVLDYWPYWLLVMTSLLAASQLYRRSVLARLKWDEYQLQLPFIGSIIKRSYLARFSRAFAISYQAGMPILEILDIVSAAVANEHIAASLLSMQRAIESGSSLAHAAEKSQLFTPLVLQMFTVGEQTGEIDRLLTDVAAMYEREVDYDIKRLSDAIEPILITILAVIVTVLALGIFLPMWDLISAFKGNI